MPTYFADTWFLIAILDRRDSHHRQARRVALSILGSPLVRQDDVLSEVLAHFADDEPSSRAVAVDAARRGLREWEVVASDRTLFGRALDRYEQRLDKEYSLVDCMSMVVMEDRRIRHVLTNDHQFTQAGFIVVDQ